MKKVILLAVVACLVSAAVSVCSAKAKKNEFGLGISVGDPVGLNCRYWISSRDAIDMALGWQGGDNTYFHIDYLYHDYASIPKGDLTGDIPFYRGLGVRWDRIIAGGNTLSMGIRFILGVDYLFNEMAGDIFAELAPTLIFEPTTTGLISASIGARYYF